MPPCAARSACARIAPGIAQTGYWVAPEARGRGLAGTALVLLSRWALATLPLIRLQLFTDVDNPASMRVAERAGFARGGHAAQLVRPARRAARRRHVLAAAGCPTVNAAPDPPLADEVVALRPWTEADVDELVRCCNDPLVPRFIPVIPVPYTGRGRPRSSWPAR